MKALRLLGYLWALPHTIVGLFLCIPYLPKKVRWSEGCLEFIAGRKKNGRTRIWGRPGAQTHGWVIFYASESAWNRKNLRVHERVHTLHALIGGPLYALAYGIHFAWLWSRSGFGPWKASYYKIWFEQKAHAKQSDYILGFCPNAWGSHV